MQHTSWRLQDAKAQFSAVVEAAVNGEAQVVTRRGKRAVVVLSAADYDRLRQGERARAPGFVEHLLAMPRASHSSARTQPPAEPTDRPALALRDVAFE